MKTKLLLASLLFSSFSALANPPAEVLNLIERTYNPNVKAVETDVTTLVDLCNRSDVQLTAQDPVTMKPGTVKLTLLSPRFSSEDRSDLRTVVIMPPTGGVNALDWAYAARICLSNYRVAVVTNWDFDTFNELDMNMHDRGALRALAAIRHTIEFLNPKRASQLGILGTSVGAISSILATGYEQRISAAALIVGGVGISEIIANSNESHLSKLRTDRMAQFKIASIKDYQKALADHCKIDPKDFINYSGRKNIWMMIGTKDDTVPTANQWEAFNLFGQPASLMFPGNHLETITHTAFADTGAIIDFFNNVLR